MGGCASSGRNQFESMYLECWCFNCYVVILFVCDGAKSNRKFLRSLGKESEMKHGVVYKTENRYCRGQHIYLMSDVPHLIKTTRNCWYSSKSGGTRYMWVSARAK